MYNFRLFRWIGSNNSFKPKPSRVGSIQALGFALAHLNKESPWAALPQSSQ